MATAMTCSPIAASIARIARCVRSFGTTSRTRASDRLCGSFTSRLRLQPQMDASRVMHSGRSGRTDQSADCELSMSSDQRRRRSARITLLLLLTAAGTAATACGSSHHEARLPPLSQVETMVREKVPSLNRPGVKLRCSYYDRKRIGWDAECRVSVNGARGLPVV